MKWRGMDDFKDLFSGVHLTILQFNWQLKYIPKFELGEY